MSKTVLHISSGGDAMNVTRDGWLDALKAAGWKVVTRMTRSKQETRQVIEHYNVGLIMTQCNYYVRQLPVDVINKKDIGVVCHAFCYNDANDTFEPFSENVDPGDVELLKRIKNLVMWSQHEPEANERWFPNWTRDGFKFIFTPHCANITRFFPSAFDNQRDTIFIGNAAHKPQAIKEWIMPVLKKRDLRHQVFGGGWENFGINARHLPPHYDNFNNIYPTSAVCLNLHSNPQREYNVLFNDRSFMIPLCGGFSISDSLLSQRYFGDVVPIARTPKEYKELTLDYIVNAEARCKVIYESAKITALLHTYFHRLRDIFKLMEWNEMAEEQKTVGQTFIDMYLENLEQVKGQLGGE